MLREVAAEPAGVAAVVAVDGPRRDGVEEVEVISGQSYFLLKFVRLGRRLRNEHPCGGRKVAKACRLATRPEEATSDGNEVFGSFVSCTPHCNPTWRAYECLLCSSSDPRTVSWMIIDALALLRAVLGQ